MASVDNQLIQVIKDKEFAGITKELVEVSIDAELPEGLLKDVPLLSTIIGVFKTLSNVKDRLFVKKLLTFLYELKDASEDDIVNEIIKLEDNHKYKTKVGEKLLFIIDKCEDIDKASLTGTLFKAFLQKKIDYDDFLATANVVEKTPLRDLLYFINSDDEDWDLEGGGSDFVAYGLMEIRFSNPKIEVSPESHYDSEHTYVPSEHEMLESRMKITNFFIKAYVNPIGHIIRDILRNVAG